MGQGGGLRRRQQHRNFSAIRLISKDELAPIAGAQLLIGIQELDAGHCSIRRQIDGYLVAEPYRLDLGAPRSQPNVGYVAAGIIT
jgi:hypothetical protein